MTDQDALRRLESGLLEEERIAREASEQTGPSWSHALYEDYPGVYNSQIESGNESFARVDYEAPAEHIVRQDPQATLAKVDAIRRALAEHRNVDGICTTCHRFDEPSREYTGVQWPCPTVRALASAYPEPGGDRRGIVIDSAEMMALHFERVGQPARTGLDATYQFQMSRLQDMVARLGVILEDEGVPDPVAERVVRAVLYGAPTESDAHERMRQQEAMAETAGRMPARGMLMTPRELQELVARHAKTGDAR